MTRSARGWPFPLGCIPFIRKQIRRAGETSRERGCANTSCRVPSRCWRPVRRRVIPTPITVSSSCTLVTSFRRSDENGCVPMLPPNIQPSARTTDILSNDVRTGTTVFDVKQSFLDNLRCGLGRSLERATRCDAYTALALTVRDRVFERGVQTLERYAEEDGRVVAYLSAEFLPGPHMANNLLSLGLTDVARQAMSELGLDFDDLLEQEEEPGLGNGGLGRLASCFLDS